jgi:hypothetical protein
MAVDVINPRVPARRWSRPYAITLSDILSEKNLQRNGSPYKYLQNVGTPGLVMIEWSDGVLVDIYISQGQVIEGGLWRHAKSTGTAIGVALRGLLGVEGVA